MTPVLFARKDSIYKQLGCDVYDIERDARSYSGDKAGVHHPPCRAWGQLSHMAKPRPDEKELAVWSVLHIQKHGGILEHPRASKLWSHMNLPLGRQVDQYGGYTLCVDQRWWGHKANKNTLLYIVGVDISALPPMPLCFDRIDYCICSSKRKSAGRLKKQLSQKNREATPPEFAKWLLAVAQMCQAPGQKGRT